MMSRCYKNISKQFIKTKV